MVKALEQETWQQGRPLPWCEGYQLAHARTELRAMESWAARSVQQWLVEANEKGLIVRQEVWLELHGGLGPGLEFELVVYLAPTNPMLG